MRLRLFALFCMLCFFSFYAYADSRDIDSGYTASAPNIDLLAMQSLPVDNSVMASIALANDGTETNVENTSQPNRAGIGINLENVAGLDYISERICCAVMGDVFIAKPKPDPLI